MTEGNTTNNINSNNNNNNNDNNTEPEINISPQTQSASYINIHNNNNNNNNNDNNNNNNNNNNLITVEPALEPDQGSSGISWNTLWDSSGSSPHQSQSQPQVILPFVFYPNFRFLIFLFL